MIQGTHARAAAAALLVTLAACAAPSGGSRGADDAPVTGNHFDALGFRIVDDASFEAVLDELILTAEVYSVDQGDYAVWTDGVGAEMWIQVVDQTLMNVSPHFNGESEVRARVERGFARDAENPLDRALQLWVAPGGAAPAAGSAGDLDDGGFPMFVDMPDGLFYEGLEPPCTATLQVAGFAEMVTAYPNVAAFDASRDSLVDPDGPEDGPRWSSESFVPVGMFDAAPGGEPASRARLVGVVRDARRLVNPLTERAYYWALIEIQGHRFDVVADDVQLDAVPKVGGVLAGEFWLSAMLLEYPGMPDIDWLDVLFGDG